MLIPSMILKKCHMYIFVVFAAAQREQAKRASYY